MKKSRLIQTILIVVFAVCTAFSAFVSVLACIPVSDDIEVVEQIKSSVSGVSAQEAIWRVDVVGALKNNTDESRQIARLEIQLESEDSDKTMTVVMENVTIPPRNIVTIAKSEVADSKYDRVKSVEALVNGETCSLRNAPPTSITVALIPLAVTAVFAFLLVRSCKVRYYMMQEDQADRQEERRGEELSQNRVSE